MSKDTLELLSRQNGKQVTALSDAIRQSQLSFFYAWHALNGFFTTLITQRQSATVEYLILVRVVFNLSKQRMNFFAVYKCWKLISEKQIATARFAVSLKTNKKLK